jgi:DNA-binding Lrp family transcriptional regulator
LKTQAEKHLATLRSLYFSESKPESLQPLDVALVTYLILRQSDDHYIRDSQDTLAERLGCERKAIRRSIDRLEKLGWITTDVPYQWSGNTRKKTRVLAKTIGLSVNLAKLPQYEDRATRSAVISDEAKELARRHNAALIKLGKYGRRPKNNFARMQERAAQRLIDEFGDFETARQAVNFALHDPRFALAAQKSLYEVRRKVRAIRAAYVKA